MILIYIQMNTITTSFDYNAVWMKLHTPCHNHVLTHALILRNWECVLFIKAYSSFSGQHYRIDKMFECTLVISIDTYI